MGLGADFDMNDGNKQDRAFKREQYKAAKNYKFYKDLYKKKHDKDLEDFVDLTPNEQMEYASVTPKDSIAKIRAEKSSAQREARKKFGPNSKKRATKGRSSKKRLEKLFGSQTHNLASVAGTASSQGEINDFQKESLEGSGGFIFEPNKLGGEFEPDHNRYVRISQGGELRESRRILSEILAGAHYTTSLSAKELRKVIATFQGLRDSAKGAFNKATGQIEYLKSHVADYDPPKYKKTLTWSKEKYNHYHGIMRDISAQARVIEGSVGAIYSGRTTGQRRAEAVFNTAGYLLNKSDGMRELRNVVKVRGKAFYLNQGGGINAADTVPAMLTPGEFVMSKSAVDAHGVGFMKNLNRGQVQGFNSGGYVSNQGVQYKQTGGGVANSNGSSVSLDPSGLSDILNNFIGDFNGGLSTVVERFSTISESLMTLSNTFSNLTMTHQFQGDMTLAFSITNGDAIKNSIAEAISPKIQEIITQELDTRLNKDFRIGQ